MKFLLSEYYVPFTKVKQKQISTPLNCNKTVHVLDMAGINAEHNIVDHPLSQEKFSTKRTCHDSHKREKTRTFGQMLDNITGLSKCVEPYTSE